MPADNFSRMIQLANEFFDAKNDPSQLDIDASVIERLTRIHPATMGEKNDENGPVAWTIVIPASWEVMEQFLEGKINEKGLLELSEQTKNFLVPKLSLGTSLFRNAKLSFSSSVFPTRTLGTRYETIYLCSAMVLAEHRRKGLAKELLCNSIRAIQKDYRITALFYWGFSDEGNRLSQAVAREVGLQVLERG